MVMLNLVLFSAIFKFLLETRMLPVLIGGEITGGERRERWMKDPKGTEEPPAQLDWCGCVMARPGKPALKWGRIVQRETTAVQ